MSHDSYPRQQARTQRFTLGRPRTFTISPDGRRILFVRSASGTDPVGLLWQLDTDTGQETLLLSPSELLAGHEEELAPEERARRERMREAASGIVSYTTDRDLTRCAFALSGRLFIVDLVSGDHRELPAQSPIVDPRIDPTGRAVAYCSRGSLRVIDVDGTSDRALVEPDGELVTWGLADFIAAEELDRSRGYWWSPEGDALLVARVDESPVDTWYVSDPTNPQQPAVAQRYPSAGRPNADVSLWHLPLAAPREEVSWDRRTWEYLASVHWSERGAPLAQVLNRGQNQSAVLAVDVTTGDAPALRTMSSPDWIDVYPGTPRWAPGGELLTIEVVDDRHALCVNGVAVSPPGLQVRSVAAVDDADVFFTAQEAPTEQHVWRWDGSKAHQVTTTPGVHALVRSSGGGSGTSVLISADLDTPLPVTTYRTATRSGVIESIAQRPTVQPIVSLLPGAPDDLRIGILLPTGHTAEDGALPVLLDPYGGPHFQSVMATQGAFRESQWWADQGFAVVVVDGRGTPGPPSWERAIRLQVASVVLADQVAGLHAAAEACPQLDLTRVAIRGWSFGGYLAALAVLDRPEVFHAAIAGAPVTDWELYDTGYTERYLGTPAQHPDAYRSCSLLTRAAALSRPLQLIHGFSDDNVFVANSLQLSQALTEHGRPHQVLPLTGITHMATKEEVAENLLRLQVEFLRQALGLGGSPMPSMNAAPVTTATSAGSSGK